MELQRYDLCVERDEMFPAKNGEFMMASDAMFEISRLKDVISEAIDTLDPMYPTCREAPDDLAALLLKGLKG